MTDEQLKDKINRYKKLNDFIKSFAEEKDNLSNDLINHFETNNIKNIELDTFDLSVTSKSKYEFSDKITKLEKEVITVTSDIKKEIKQVKELEKQQGIATKIEGKPYLVIKEK